MKVLLDKAPVFQCHKGRWDAIYFSELGSSWAILAAGYNLDSLMLRYQGVDWRNKDNWNCNARCALSGCWCQAACMVVGPVCNLLGFS
jgi:hypothetical protein